MSNTTRHEPDRARAGSGRPSGSKTGRAAGPGRRARFDRPARRPPGASAHPPYPAVPAAAVAAPATRPRQRPHRPPAKVVPPAALAPTAGLGERDLHAPGAARPLGPHPGHVAGGGPADRRPGPARRRVPGGGARRVLHSGLAALVARWHLRPRRRAAGALRPHRRRRGRRLPDRASGADGHRALAHHPRSRRDAGRRAAPADGLRRPGPPAPPVDRADDLRRRLPRHLADRRLQAGGAQREPRLAGRRVHQRRRSRARPDSSTGTTACWPASTARRRSCSRPPAWRCPSPR